MSGNFAIKGGEGVGGLMANAILNFHFDFLHTSLTHWTWKVLEEVLLFMDKIEYMVTTEDEVAKCEN